MNQAELLFLVFGASDRLQLIMQLLLKGNKRLLIFPKVLVFPVEVLHF